MYYIKNSNVQDLYILPSTQVNREIVYSPLRGIAFMVDSKTAQNLMVADKDNPVVNRIIEKLPTINCQLDTTNNITIKELSQNLVILLSNSCNLGCKYCYAQFERENGFLSKNKIKNIIDYVLEVNKHSTIPISISFLGGGEPTLNWDLLVWSIKYARKQESLYGIQLRIGFPTNATLLNEEKIDFLVKHHVEVGVSFELLPDIQNKQRPFANSSAETYKVVRKNVHLLNENGIQTRFRSTITPTYVHRLEEMVEHVAKEFPFIKKIHFEPVYPLLYSSEDSSINEDMFYDKFIEHFMAAKCIGDLYNLDITTAATNTLNKIKPRYCRGELCVTPNGDIVICHRSSSEKDNRYDDFRYGSVTDDSVIIDEVKFQKVNNLLSYKKPQCDRCFSKWHCSGMCLSNRAMFTERQFQSYCTYVRNIQSKYIESVIMKGGVLNESNRSFCE